MTPLIRVIHCSFCQREFRGTSPYALRDRHEAAHRSETVLAVSCGAT